MLKTRTTVLQNLEPLYLTLREADSMNRFKQLLAYDKDELKCGPGAAPGAAQGPSPPAPAHVKRRGAPYLAVELRVLVEGVVELQRTLLQPHGQDGRLPRARRPDSEVLLLKERAQLLCCGSEKRREQLSLETYRGYRSPQKGSVTSENRITYIHQQMV